MARDESARAEDEGRQYLIECRGTIFNGLLLYCILYVVSTATKFKLFDSSVINL